VRKNVQKAIAAANKAHKGCSYSGGVWCTPAAVAPDPKQQRRQLVDEMLWRQGMARSTVPSWVINVAQWEHGHQGGLAGTTALLGGTLSSWGEASAGAAASEESQSAGILAKAEAGPNAGNRNYGVGYGTMDEVIGAGLGWVGDGARLNSAGNAWISADGLRQFRFPSWKDNTVKRMQANFESRDIPKGNWVRNGHADVSYGPSAG